VTRLTPDGTALAYSTYLGASASEFGNGIAVDAGGSAYVTGRTSSANFPTTPGAFDTTYGGSLYDGFVAELNAAGSGLVYSTFLGGSGTDNALGIAVDGGGNAFVTGLTTSTDFPATPGAFDTTYNGANDGFVTRLNAAGSGLVYATFLGGSRNDNGSAIALDGSGDAFVAGRTASPNFPTTPGAFDTTLNNRNGTNDAFVTKLNAAGSGLVYSTFLGGTGADAAFGIAVDSAGEAFVAGWTDFTDFPTTPRAFDTTFNYGGWDTFVTKLNGAGSGLVYSTYLGGYTDDLAYGIALDGSGSAYVTGATDSRDFPTTPGAFMRRDPNGDGAAFVSKFTEV
jgi:hypothetical protein